MIRQRFIVPELRWRVNVYYSVTTYYTEEILERLSDIGCRGEMLETAEDNMRSGKLDTGLTYSNPIHRETVLVIGKASSKREFFDSYTHEFRHLQDDLGKMNGISLSGEQIAYLSGYISQKVYRYVRMMICDCSECRTEIKRISNETR